MNQIEIIKRSTRCLVLAWLSLVPVVGLPCGIGALIVRRRVYTASRGEWNPAAVHLRWGAMLACLGCVISLVAIELIVAAVVND